MSAKRSRVVPGLATAAIVVVLAGCSATEHSPNHHPTGQQSASPAATQVALDPPLGHLHGLHLDAGDAVLAGTHTGVFQIEMSGGTTKIGTSDDDFMGLAGVPGTNELFASGHPGPSSTAPNPLGLTASADGVTGIVASTDGGRTWTAGAALSAAALAVTDAGVWATTADGLQRSTDAGRTFAVVPDAPALRLISAAADGSLWGVDTSGVAWRSKTGETWERRASALGDGAVQVEAVLAIDFGSAHAVSAQTLITLG